MEPTPPPGMNEPPPPYSGSPAQPPSQTIIVQQAAPTTPTLTWYHGKQSAVLGAVQITCGLVAILFQSLAIYSILYEELTMVVWVFYLPGVGIWTGITVGEADNFIEVYIY